MHHRIKVVQALRVEKSITILVEGDTIADAIEAIGCGEVELPSASDDPGQLWAADRCSLEHEEALPG